MLIGFDWDGTLVQTFTADPLPGVREALAALPVGTRTFIAANLPGPVSRQVLGQSHFPTVEEIADRIAAGLAALAWRPDLLLISVHSGKNGDDWRSAAEAVAHDFARSIAAIVPGTVVSADPAWRKPAPGMLDYAARQLQADAAAIVYVGDAPSDQEAAQAAGAQFRWAADFVHGEGNNT